ncbi:MAG: hypothetical protein M0R03_08800 [Novosphingobium sp.]|nr:hypothetical protein [Novosphingobium sp.]
MKVKELIDFLQKGNEEAEIIIKSSSGIMYDIIEEKIIIEAYGAKIKESDKFNIRIS